MENAKQRKPLVALLHGAGVTSAWWHPQVQALSSRFDLLTPDLPGHGDSSGQPFSMEQSINLIHNLLSREKDRPAVLVGISLGGYVAMAFAARYPQLTRGLVLSGCSMNLSGLAGLGFRLTGLMLRIRGTDWIEEGTLRSYRKRIPPERLDPVLDAGMHFASAIDAFKQASGRNYHRLARNYKKPVLILNGAGDEPNTKHQNRLLEQLHSGTLIVMENAGHLASLEKPETFNAEVSRFIDSLP